MSDKIEVLNINVPGHVTRVDAAKYTAMKQALFMVVPDAPPGLTAKQIKQAAIPHLPDELFPAGQTAGWWVKCVRTLEARGAMARGKTAPLRFWRTPPDAP